MAQNKNDEGSVQPNESVAAAQVKPTRDRSKADVKASILHEPDKDLHPDGLPEHPADQTSVPGPKYPPADRPPVATTRHDEGVLLSLVTGAGEHTPPDPEKYDAEGRLRD